MITIKVITSVQRCRRWETEEKRASVEEAGVSVVRLTLKFFSSPPALIKQES